MNRQERKAVRLEIISILDKECKSCSKARKFSRSNNPYCYTKCQVGQRLLELSRSLKRQEEVVKVESEAKRPVGGQEGGVNRRWTDKEVRFLIENKGRMSLAKMASKLKRSPKSVGGKIYALQQKGMLVNKNVD
ncbi:hypothetical protein ACFOU2_09830 [Bacillus songklensis]|uniref:Zinc-finger domain-containing protein n=1 Tax=Bacillus songklensis TaxID=1069116 RepID=A0ABV8B3P8_9BACI